MTLLCSGSPTCSFLCSTSPLRFYFCQLFLWTSPHTRAAGSVRTETAQGWLGLAPGLRQKIPTLPQPVGPECSWDSWSVILHVLPGIWRAWGPWRAPASCHSWGPYKLPQFPFLACSLQSQASAASTEACLLVYSPEQLPADPVNDKQASAGLNQEAKSC